MKEMTTKNTSFVKVLAITVVLCLTTTLSFTQLIEAKATPKAKLSPYGKVETNWYKIGWFADINGGTRLLGATSAGADLGAGLNLNAGVGFFITDRIGIKGRLDYNTFKFTPGFNSNPESRGRMWSASIEATSDLLPFTHGTKIRDWRIELHGGFGLSTYRNTDYADYREDIWSWDDPALKGNDDMIHMIIGVTPQYHINGRWSINLDFSSFFLFKQDVTFDRFNVEKLNGIGNVLSTSLGITFRP